MGVLALVIAVGTRYVSWKAALVCVAGGLFFPLARVLYFAMSDVYLSGEEVLVLLALGGLPLIAATAGLAFAFVPRRILVT